MSKNNKMKKQQKLLKQVINSNALIIRKKQNKRKQKGKMSFKSLNPREMSLYKSSRFAFALRNPFNPSAMGTQVPDPYSFPTATYHIHNTTVIGNPTGSNYTLGSICFLPNPILTAIDFLHVNTAATADAQSITQTPMQRFGSTNTALNYSFLGATTPDDMYAKFSAWRVVSWGLKLSNLLPELSATGRVIIAPIPISDTVPNYNQCVNMTIKDGIQPVLGLPTGACNSSSLLTLPGAIEVSIGDLLHGDLELLGMYTSAGFFEFKSSINNVLGNTGVYEGDSSSFNLTSGLTSNNAFKDLTRMRGGVAYVIYFEGIPASTPNALQVELIMHLEGAPAISSTSNTGLVSSTLPTTHVGSTGEVEEGLSLVSTVDKCIKFVTRGASFLNNNKQEILSGINAASSLYSNIKGFF